MGFAEDALLEAWLQAVREEGIEEATATTAATAAEKVQQMLRLGFEPSVQQAKPRDTTDEEKKANTAGAPSNAEQQQEEGPPTSAAATQAKDNELAASMQQEENVLYSYTQEEEGAPESEEPLQITWRLPVSYENGPLTYVLERQSEIRKP